MKCQRKRSPYRACFASRSWARFSPTTSMPASASACISSTVTYFVATTTVTDGPASALMRSYRSRSSSGDTREDSLDAARLPVAPVGEEELGMARSAEIESLHLRDTGRTQCLLGCPPQIEARTVHNL